MNAARKVIKTYTDPDVLALVQAAGGLIDPRSIILSEARKLNNLYRQFDVVGDTPMERLQYIASLRGLTIEAMEVERRRDEHRDAIIIFNSSGKGKLGHILYNPDRPMGRIAFSIAHEIAHTFFDATSKGARFREICRSDSREANELERLCDLGAAEILMPEKEFASSVAGAWSLECVPRIARTFGSSQEATIYRLASAYPGSAAAGSLQFRRTKGDEAKLASLSKAHQTDLFEVTSTRTDPHVSPAKYRRQAFHKSGSFRDDDVVRWNKSFDENSIVYRINPGQIETARESLPNGRNTIGIFQAMQAPYQREDVPAERPDVLFYWKAA